MAICLIAVFVLPVTSNAATKAELQAQIQSLMAMVQQLQAQLAVLQAKSPISSTSTGSGGGSAQAVLQTSPPISSTGSGPSVVNGGGSTQIGTVTSIRTVSVCDLQNHPSQYVSVTLQTQGTVTVAGSTQFFLEDQGCKVQVSSWAPFSVTQCPPSSSTCSSFPIKVMSYYIGKTITLEGQLNQQLIFQGNPVSTSTGTIIPSNIDILSFMLKADPSTGLKSSDPSVTVTFHQIVSGNNFYLEKWDNSGQIVHYSYDNNYIYLKDDSTDVYPYRFDPPAIWANRYMKVGDTVSGSQGAIDEFTSSCAQTSSKRPWPYQITLSNYYPSSTNWGGSIGKDEAIVLSYSWGGTVENEYYAKGYGLFKWNVVNAAGTQGDTVILNMIDNAVPAQPNPPCFDLSGNLKNTPTSTPSFTPAQLTTSASGTVYAPGSTLPNLTSAAPTFYWSGGSQAYGYWLVVSDASGNIINSGSVLPATASSKTINSPALPTDGSMLKVRLYTLHAQGDTSHYVDYTVKAFNSTVNVATLPTSLSGFIGTLYSCVLNNNAPDQAGVSYWLGNLQNKSLTIPQTYADFFGYQSGVTPAITNNQFAQKLYGCILFRPVDTSSYNNVMAGLSNGNLTQAGLVQAVLNSSEFTTGILPKLQALK